MPGMPVTANPVPAPPATAASGAAAATAKNTTPATPSRLAASTADTLLRVGVRDVVSTKSDLLRAGSAPSGDRVADRGLGLVGQLAQRARQLVAELVEPAAQAGALLAPPGQPGQQAARVGQRGEGHRRDRAVRRVVVGQQAVHGRLRAEGGVEVDRAVAGPAPPLPAVGLLEDSVEAQAVAHLGDRGVAEVDQPDPDRVRLPGEL